MYMFCCQSIEYIVNSDGFVGIGGGYSRKNDEDFKGRS